MKTALWILGIIVVIFLGYYFWYMPMHATSYQTTNPNVAKGTVVFSFTDQTSQIQNVNEVHMEVDKVQLYSQTQGWVDVSSNDVDYKLLDLKAKGQSQIYASADVPADTYTATRVTLKKVVIDTKTKGQKTAITPKNEFDISGSIRVLSGKTSSMHIDVLADQSLHLASNGSDYVFAPAIKTEARSATTVNVSAGGVVTITDGTVDTLATAGMDVDGSMKSNFKIDANTGINVSGGVIQLNVGATTTTSGTLKTNTGGGTVNGTVNGVINY